VTARIDARAVNAALRAAVVDEQQRFAALTRRAAKRVPPSPDAPPGIFKTTLDRRLVSASTAVVSTLLPWEARRPESKLGAGWVSATLRVPQASRVRITDLFERPSTGLDALARIVRERVLATNACVREAAEYLPDLLTRGLRPLPRNYRHFGLTPEGLTIGFPMEQISSQSCWRVQVDVPYSALEPYLSPEGRRLIDGVRRPS
jgi:hypothetical protein